MGAVNVLEREDARQAVDSALDAARSGGSRTLFLVGDAGLGKTTLLDQACSMARACGFAVGHARCSEVEASIPFGMIDRVFSDLGLRGPSIGEGGASPTDMLAARYVRLSDWVRHEAPQPLLIAVDDMQWSDPDSTALLAALCRRLGGLAVAVVAAMRGWPSGSLDQARSLVRDGLARQEHLEPLSEEASRALLQLRLGRELPAELTGRAHQSCAGNPLLLVEVADSWGRGEDLLSGPGPLGERVFLPRFAGVGREALRWARGASILGSRFHPLLVAGLVGQSVPEASVALQALCDSGVVRAATDGDGEFVHPLFRQALYEDIALPVRQALHARAFNLLRDLGTSVAEAAAHAVAADLRGDPSALEAVLSSARAAMSVGAVATAAEHFFRATTLAGAATAQGVWLELGRACLLAGRIDQGEMATRRFLAAGGLDDAGRVAGMRLLAQILMASARQPEAARCLEEASALAGRSDPALAAEILLDSTFMGWIYTGPRRARVTTRRVLEMIGECGTDAEHLRRPAQIADSYLACLVGQPYGIEEMAAGARSAVARPDAHELRSAWGWDPLFGYFNLAKIVERFEDDMAAFPVLADLTRRQGSTLTYWSYAVNHADTLWRLGRLDEGYTLLREGLAVAAVLPGIAPYASVGLAHISHELGRREESASWATHVEAAMSEVGETAYLRLWLLLISCRDDLCGGRVERSVQAAERAAAVASESGILEPCVIPWHGAAIEAYVAAGMLDEAAELAGSLEALCQPLPCHAPRAVAAAGLATVEWRRGHVDAAEALYDKALAHNAAVPMPLAEAETWIAYGRFLRHTGRVARARTALHRALAVLEPTGAGRLSRAAAEELAAAGGRRPRRSSELTPQERRVASLAATGLTNKEIAQRLYVTAKTVEHHLSAVYSKLDMSSRRQLMLEWQGDLEQADQQRT